VVTWAVFEKEAPALVAVAHLLWPGITTLDREGRPPPTGPCFTVAYLATVRADGAPRLHPFCPVIADGHLFAAIPRSSPKGGDLRRDGRCVIHAMPGPEDDELCIRATATEVPDGATRELVRAVVSNSGVSGMINTVTADPLFEFDLIQVDVAHWLDIGKANTRAVRSRYIPS